MSNLVETNLFKPLQLGAKVRLSHRVVLPPLTRARGTKDYIASDLNLKYYDDRLKNQVLF